MEQPFGSERSSGRHPAVLLTVVGTQLSSRRGDAGRPTPWNLPVKAAAAARGGTRSARPGVAEGPGAAARPRVAGRRTASDRRRGLGDGRRGVCGPTVWARRRGQVAGRGSGAGRDRAHLPAPRRRAGRPRLAAAGDRGRAAGRHRGRRPGQDQPPLPLAPRAVHRPGGGAGAGRPVLHPPADRRPNPRRSGDELRRCAAVGRHDGVGVQQPRLRAVVLGARQRRRGRPRPSPAAIPPASRSRSR
jgi:hypothetical protein